MFFAVTFPCYWYIYMTFSIVHRYNTARKKKEYLRLFVHKTYSTIGILSIYHSVLSFTEKSCTLLKHRNLLARVDVCYLWKTTWLWQLRRTPPNFSQTRMFANFFSFDGPRWSLHCVKMTIDIPKVAKFLGKTFYFQLVAERNCTVSSRKSLW